MNLTAQGSIRLQIVLLAATLAGILATAISGASRSIVIGNWILDLERSGSYSSIGVYIALKKQPESVAQAEVIELHVRPDHTLTLVLPFTPPMQMEANWRMVGDDRMEIFNKSETDQISPPMIVMVERGEDRPMDRLSYDFNGLIQGPKNVSRPLYVLKRSTKARSEAKATK